MNSQKMLGIVILVVGLLARGYGSFSYTKQTHEAKIGPLELSVKEQQTVNIPVWAGGAAVAVGLLLLVVGGGRRG